MNWGLGGGLSAKVGEVLLDFLDLEGLQAKVFFKLGIGEPNKVGSLDGVLLEGTGIQSQTHDEVADIVNRESRDIDTARA